MSRKVPHPGRTVRAGARVALRLTPLACVGGLIIAGGPSWASGSETSVNGSTANCAVEIQIGSASATAVVLSGCQGGDYWFSSWVTQSPTYQPGASQQLLDATDHAPWVVRLPTSQPCYYQLDFSERQVPPGHAGGTRTLIASHTGQAPSCSGASSTTATSSTTASSSTTATSQSTVSTAPVTVVPILPATTLALATPTKPPAIASSSATGTTSTTATTQSGAGPVPPQQSPSPSVVPAVASPASHAFGSLAFTGFAVLMAVFVALVLLVTGIGLVRLSRSNRRIPFDPGSPGPRPEG